MENTLHISDLKAFATDYDNIENNKLYYGILKQASNFVHNESLAMKTSIARATVKSHFKKALEVVFDAEEKLDQNFETRNEIMIKYLNQMRQKNEHVILQLNIIFLCCQEQGKVCHLIKFIRKLNEPQIENRVQHQSGFGFIQSA